DQFERAVKWYRHATEQSLEANDLTAVLDRAKRGVACGASGEELGLLRLCEAEAHVWRGELTLAEQHGIEATALLAIGAAAWCRAAAQAVIAAGKAGVFARTEGWVTAASAANPEGDARNARIICLNWCATYLIFGGRYGAADTLIKAFEPMPALNFEAVALIQETRSIPALVEGDLGGCLDGLLSRSAAFEQAEDHRNVCAARANLGFVYAELGDFESAEGALRAALTTAERMGLHNLSLAALHNLGHVLAYRGYIEEALQIETRSIE